MTEMMGRWLIGLGLFLILLGFIFVLGSRFQIPIGRLPGDIFVRKENFSFYFPIATSIILSILLSLILFLISLFVRK